MLRCRCNNESSTSRSSGGPEERFAVGMLRGRGAALRQAAAAAAIGAALLAGAPYAQVSPVVCCTCACARRDCRVSTMFVGAPRAGLPLFPAL